MTTETEPDLDIRLINYPPSGSEISFQTVAFGPVGPMRLMLEMDSDGDDVQVTITVGNAAEHDELPAFLGDVVELLRTVVESQSTIEAITRASAEASA